MRLYDAAAAVRGLLTTLLVAAIFLSRSQGFDKLIYLLETPPSPTSRNGFPILSSRFNSPTKDTISSAGEGVVDDVELSPMHNRSFVQAKFIGSTHISSERCLVPLVEASNHFMADFFKYEEHRNLLFPAESCSSIIDLGVPTESQRDHILSISQGYFASLDPTDEVRCNILEIKSPGINFAGLKVNALNTMASQLVARCTDQQHEYRFMLLGSKVWAEGPKPMVWLFKKLTTSDYIYQEEVGLPKQQMSYSVTRLWAELDDNRQVVFNVNATLEIRVNIPKRMMRLIPMKFEKFEKQGSTAIQKLLDRDLQQSIKRLKDKYVSWIAD